MVVVLGETDYDQWLDASVGEVMSFMQRYPAEALVAVPDPRPPVVE